jgi:hypothetical protein
MSFSFDMTGTRAAVSKALHQHTQSIPNPSEQAAYEKCKELAILAVESAKGEVGPNGVLPLLSCKFYGSSYQGMLTLQGPTVSTSFVVLDPSVAGVSADALAAAQEGTKEAQQLAAQATADLQAAKDAQASAEAKALELAAKLADAEAALAATTPAPAPAAG